jgi:hypothetical protein
MRTILIAGFLSFFSTMIQAQSIIDKLFDKYSGTEGYTSVYISKYMFDMFRSDENNSDKTNAEMDKVISRLNGIKILVTDDDPTTPTPISLYSEMMKLISSSPYKEIMVVKEKDQNIKFYVREQNGKVAELLMVIGGKSECLISIQGDIDMKNISKLAKSMEIQGFENLEKMEK